ncbi:MAG: flagellar basal body rod protein FlgC [Micavibrio sp.]
MSDLYGAMTISAFGMKAQSQRVRVIAENMANASTAANSPDEDPYARKTITFKNEMNRAKGMDLVQVDKIEEDKKQPFILKYNPDHPGADEKGYVKMPNIDPIIETMDMREAQRSYEANLGMIDQSRNMIMQTIDLLRK